MLKKPNSNKRQILTRLLLIFSFLFIAILGAAAFGQLDVTTVTEAEAAEVDSQDATTEVTQEATAEATEEATPSIAGDTEMEEQPAVETTPEATTDRAAEMPASEPAVRAELFLDYEVLNSAGEEVGEIEDLLIGLNSGQVTYALFSFDEFFDLDEPLYLIPLNKFSIGPQQQQITLDVTQEILETAPGFAGEEELPDFDLFDWDVENRAFWIDTDIGPEVEPIGEDVTLEGTLEATVEPTLEGLEGGPEEEATVEPTEEAMLATPTVTATGEMTDTMALTATDTATATGEASVRASELLEYEVINLNDEELGEVEELIVGLDSNKLNYIVLAAGGFLGLGEDLFAVPFSAFEIDQQEEVTLLDVNEDNLANAPGFELENWPDTTVTDWDVEAQSYWGRGLTPAAPAVGLLGVTVDEPGLRATNLVGLTLQNGDGETLGTIEDLAVSQESGVVSYAMLSTGETTDTLTALPFYAILLTTEDNVIVADLDSQVVAEAPQFESWPELTTEAWDEAITDYWRGSAIGVAPDPTAVGVTVTGAGEPAVRATDLLDTNVTLSQEDSLPIEDLIIGSVGRQVNYIVVALSEEGQTQVPIPFLVFSPGVEEEGFNFNLDVPLETLENAPQIEAENWPDTLDPRWDVAYFNYWAGRLAQVSLTNLRASNLLGYEVFDLQGQDMGEVEDLIVNMDNGQISYAILELGDFLETEQELFPIPLSALQPNAQQLAFMLDLDPATLANAPAFNEDTWPDLTTPEWDESYTSFWQENLDMSADMEMTSGRSARVSSLLDYDVQGNQEEEIGEIEELVVDFQNNQVKYAILSFGGFLDIGDEEVPIPLTAFSLQPENELLLLDADEQMLEDAPELDDDFWTNPVDEEIETEIGNYWETE